MPLPPSLFLLQHTSAARRQCVPGCAVYGVQDAAQLPDCLVAAAEICCSLAAGPVLPKFGGFTWVCVAQIGPWAEKFAGSLIAS